MDSSSTESVPKFYQDQDTKTQTSFLYKKQIYLCKIFLCYFSAQEIQDPTKQSFMKPVEFPVQKKKITLWSKTVNSK